MWDTLEKKNHCPEWLRESRRADNCPHTQTGARRFYIYISYIVGLDLSGVLSIDGSGHGIPRYK